jgi:hypothetical protein
MKDLNKLLSFIQNAQGHRVRLYLVTRTIKQGNSKRARKLDKYEYNCLSINTDKNIQKELFNLFAENVTDCANKDKFSIEKYSIVTDDIEKKILLYTEKERISSFMHIVDEDLKDSSELTPVTDISNIAENLWAYIIEISLNDQIVCGLRKMSPSKVLVSEKGNVISASFKMKEKSLVLSNEQSIVFDKRLDVLYVDDIFYVIQKNNFEKIVGLESEYIEEAKLVVDKIMHSSNIEISSDFDLLGEVESKNRFIRKFTKIKNEIDKIDSNRIKKMQKIASSFGLKNFIVNKGKIIINNDEELDTVVKLIDDHYLSSQQTDKKYEASVKKEI